MRRALKVKWFGILLLLIGHNAWADPPQVYPDLTTGQLLTVTAGTVRAYSLETGQEMWRQPVPGGKGQLFVMDQERYLATPADLSKLSSEGDLSQVSALGWGPVKIGSHLYFYRQGELVQVNGPTVALEEEPQRVEAFGDGILVLTQKSCYLVQGGKVTATRPRPQKADGPWLVGETVLFAQSDALVAEQFGKGRNWRYRLDQPLKGRPVVHDQVFYAITEGDEAIALTSSGRPHFKISIPAGDVSIFVDEFVHYVVQNEAGLNLKTTNLKGISEGEWSLPGTLTRGEWLGQDLYLFLTTRLEEPEIHTNGRPVLNLKTGEPRMVDILGHKILRLHGPEAPEEIANEPRQSLVGPLQKSGQRLLYATQLRPQRMEGEAFRLDPRFPYQPVILRGLGDQQSWSYEADSRPEGPSKDRLPEKAFAEAEGNLVFTTEGKKLAAVSVKDGQLAWQSSTRVKLDESVPLFVEDDQGLTLVSQVGSLHYLYRFSPQDGQQRWATHLTDLFIGEKINNLVGVIIICAALCYFIFAARRRELFIRRIAGLNALDEAVGRATEMGKPVLYVTGLADVDDIQTLASLSILGHVARKTAEYDTPILVPTSRAVAFSAAQEVVKEAYTAVGRPDAFVADNVRYLTDDQFGYTAGIDGMMLREKPAANFYMGKFYAESLILAETGHATGAIQIAGTAMPSQLPFFVAACDYTLIGEELFAASAYLSKDPLQVGSLRGQDVGKAIVMVSLLLGALASSFGYDFVKGWFAT